MLPLENKNLLFFEASGFSMWPFLKGREKLIVKKLSPSYLTSGDLILYNAGGQLICHRLVRKRKREDKYLLYANADASFGLPDLVTEEMFLGKVIGIIDGNKLISYDRIKYKLINKVALAIAPVIGLAIKIYMALFKKI